MAAAFNKFQSFVEILGLGDHHLDAAGDTFKCYLTNNVPDTAADNNKADLATATEEHGYTAEDVQNDYTETAGTGTMTCVDITITAAGGTVGPFQYVPMYNDTHASDALVCWWDYGSEITLADGESFTIDFGASTLSIA